MSYQGYVIAAYLVFAAVLLWDFVAPRIAIRQQARLSGELVLVATRSRLEPQAPQELQV